MFINNNEINKALVDYANITPIPDALANDVFCLWKGDFTQDDDWNHFVGGQKTLHLTYDGRWFGGKLLLNSLSQGNSAQTYEGMMNYNDKMTIITKDFVEIPNGYMVGFRDKQDKFYFAASYPVQYQLDGQSHNGIIVLQEINSFLNDNFEEFDLGYASNVMVGKNGTTFNVPHIKRNFVGIVDNVEIVSQTMAPITQLEVEYTNGAGILGIEAYKGDTRTLGNYSVDDVNKYCIVPTQFNTWTIDNYGIAHSADTTNQLKAIAYTQQVSNAIQDGSQAGGSMFAGGGSAGSLASIIGGTTKLVSSILSGANKMFMGDARSLSSETAISSKFLDNDSSFLKLFIQPTNNIADINTEILLNGDRLFKPKHFGIQQNGYRAANIMQAAGAFLQDLGTSDDQAITTLPNPELVILNPHTSNNENQYYAMVGNHLLQNVKQTNKTLPWLKAPYANDDKFKINNGDIQNYLSFGVPRKNISDNTQLAPLLHPRDWTMGFRWQGFRPSPYTWINYPIMFPAEIGIYDVINQGNPVGYLYDGTNGTEGKETYWTKGFTISDLANKNVGNNRKLKTNIHMEDSASTGVDRLETIAITKSSVKVKAKDANGNILKTYIFKSSGQRFDNGAMWGSIYEL